MNEFESERWRALERTYRCPAWASYRAFDEELEREVELDVVKATGLSPEDMDDLRRLVSISADFGGPVFRVLGWREEGESLVICRERTEGTLLSDLLGVTGSLPRDQVGEIVSCLVEVLAESYGKGLFYLGINPGQVFVLSRGGARVNRPGFGWLLEEYDPVLAGRVSPYRAPEAEEGGGSRVSDVYSLAVMVKEMIREEETGERLSAFLQACVDPFPRNRPTSPRLLLEALVGDEPTRADGVERGGEEPAPPGGGTPGAKARGGLRFIVGGAGRPAPSARTQGRGRFLRFLFPLAVLGLFCLAAWSISAARRGSPGGSAEGAGETVREAVTLPDLRGLTEEEALGVLEEMGLEVDFRPAPSILWSEGRVAAQEPPRGSRLEKGERVYLVISTGRDGGDGGKGAECRGEGAESGTREEKDKTSATGETAGGMVEKGEEEVLVPSADASAASRPPVAVAVLSSTSGPAPLPVIMDASSSYDPDGEITCFTWYCGDGAVLHGPTVQHVFDSMVIPARFEVVLVVTDEDGLSGRASVAVELL